jgi:hypothetical protein
VFVQRILLGVAGAAGVFLLGYYLGKQVGRTEPIREELDRAREAAAGEAHDQSPD